MGVALDSQRVLRYGESDWQDFLRHWKQYGIDHWACLEIECGAGRITKQLATCFAGSMRLTFPNT
jgi:hypothetical protein